MCDIHDKRSQRDISLWESGWPGYVLGTVLLPRVPPHTARKAATEDEHEEEEQE